MLKPFKHLKENRKWKNPLPEKTCWVCGRKFYSRRSRIYCVDHEHLNTLKREGVIYGSKLGEGIICGLPGKHTDA